MGAAEKLAPAKLTFEEFVEFSLQSEAKYEFHSGDLVMMAGGTKNHAAVACNLAGELRDAWKSGNGCQPYGSDVLVRVPERKSGFYPDVSVVCGEQEFEQTKSGDDAVLLNPVLVIEVLSPSTTKFDLTEKFEAYRTIASLREYVVIDPDRASVQTFCVRGEMWSIGPSYSSIEQTIRFESVNAEIPMSEVYRGIELLPPEEHGVKLD